MQNYSMIFLNCNKRKMYNSKSIQDKSILKKVSKRSWSGIFLCNVFHQPEISSLASAGLLYRMVENDFSHRIFECQTLKHHRFQTRHPILTRLAPMASSFQELYLAHEFLRIGWGKAVELRLKSVISLNYVWLQQTFKEKVLFLWKSAEAKLLLSVWWNSTWKN